MASGNLFPGFEGGLQPFCRQCGRGLAGASQLECPQCGARFDPADPRTYRIGAGFVRWRYWLPGLLMASLFGFAALALCAVEGSWGYAVVVGIPLSIGGAIGYGTRVKVLVTVLLSLAALATILVGGYSLSLSGVLCSLLGSAILLGPLLMGCLFGFALRSLLKDTRFSQRRFLPVVLIFGACLSWLWLESRLSLEPTEESVQTVRTLNIDVDQAWANLAFYEDVPGPAPWLVRIGLPQPVGTVGRLAAVGDIKVCLYDKGRLVKKITRIEPARLLAFDVIEQKGIEDRSLRLTSGSFEFEAPTPGQTRVTLTTRYVPKLQARLFWRPFERALAHALHDHVIAGLERPPALSRNDR